VAQVFVVDVLLVFGDVDPCAGRWNPLHQCKNSHAGLLQRPPDTRLIYQTQTSEPGCISHVGWLSAESVSARHMNGLALQARVLRVEGRTCSHDGAWVELVHVHDLHLGARLAVLCRQVAHD